MALAQFVKLRDSQGVVAVNDKFYIGTTKESRKIYESNLDVDYLVTRIVVDCTSVNGVTPQSPFVIRVYQSGVETDFAGVDVSGEGTFSEIITVDITQAQGANRTLVIDAWDPDDTSPNNNCSITGTITVFGTPKLATQGAS